MPARGSRRRDDVTELELVGGPEKRTLVLVEHDPAWADVFAGHAARIRSAVGAAVVDLEHIGSTSVPGLAAKPIVDILLTVPDITAEEDHVEPLVAAGYALRVREPGHRMLRTPARDVHLHVVEPDAPEAADYLLLRDRLRSDEADRRLYESVKRELIGRDWPDMNAYADAKTDVVEAIKARARAHGIPADDSLGGPRGGTVSERVRRRVHRDFGARAADVVDVLAAMPETSQSGERMQLAILLRADGNFAQLGHAVSLAKTDWRDLLMYTGLEHADFMERLERELGPRW